MLLRYRNSDEKEEFIKLLEPIIAEYHKSSEASFIHTPGTYEIANSFDLDIPTNLKINRSHPPRMQLNRFTPNFSHILIATFQNSFVTRQQKKKAEEMVQDASAKKLNNFLCYDMKNNSGKYINLLKRKVFNPHKCNVLFDSYVDKADFANSLASIWVTDLSKESYNPDFSIAKGNLPLLYAILTSYISHKETTIIDCDTIYQKCGVACNPINPTFTQAILFNIYTKVKDSSLYTEWLENYRKEQRQLFNETDKLSNISHKYCRIDIPLSCYDFSSDDNHLWDFLSFEEIIKENDRKRRERISKVENRGEKSSPIYIKKDSPLYKDEKSEHISKKIWFLFTLPFIEESPYSCRMGCLYSPTIIHGNQFTAYIPIEDIMDLPIDYNSLKFASKHFEVYLSVKEEFSSRKEFFER